MNYILLLTISSSVVSVIGFLVSIFKDFKWNTSLLCIVSAVTFTYMSIYIRKLETRIERTENIQRAALKLVDHRDTRFSSEGFVQAALSFLEINKDLYPDTYMRAIEIERRMHESESIYAGSDAASELSGIIYGIAILNEE
ncbi:MAG: hypothetical protein IKJ92_06415 [Bacteroidaceae bacterium]|nr:hypothetical protein [Bacteroidaceae bacterium]